MAQAAADFEIDPATGLPIGRPVSDPSPAPRPQPIMLEGRFVRLEPLDPARHGDALYRAAVAPGAEARHLYLFEDAPPDRATFDQWLAKAASSTDPLFWAAVDPRNGATLGRAALMRITPEHRVIEVGSILWGPGMARSPASTESVYLFARHVFEDLGYRRFEWKCHALNAPSRKAALRLGFRFEGIFRDHMIAKGRVRHTAWFAMTHEDWPSVRRAFEAWLAPGNFDAQGQQNTSLAALRVPSLWRATLADLDAVVSLQQESYAQNVALLGTTPIPLLADYRDIFSTHEVHVAQDGQGLVGALIIKPHDDHLHVWSVATAPRARGIGLGSHLLRHAEHIAADRGLPSVRLLTGERLVDNVGWYHRNGYRITHVDEVAGRRVVHFEKALAP
jgi:RimJ/RimL family protein N-acetyltransferase/GNAT superfamily N-acetyltransferase